MTDNIEKLYELAEIEKVGKKHSCKISDFYNCITRNCYICDKAQDKNYPPFTNTKQLELIKWLAFERRVSIKFINAKWHLYTAEMGISASAKYETFEQLLAEFICNIWKDLTDEQREEVRGILQ